MSRSRAAALCALAAALALLALPAAGRAAVTLGATDMAATPSLYRNSMADLTVALRTPGPGLQVEAPSSGVVVLWRVRVGTTANPSLRLRVLRRVGTNVIIQRSGRPVGALNGLNEFPARVAISAGESVGFDLPNGIGLYYRGATGSTWGTASPIPADGATVPETSIGGEIVFQAVVEPDADRDGFGDETQDACLRQPGTDAGCPAPTGSQGPSVPPSGEGPGADTTRPRLTALGVRPRRLAPGAGATFRFSLSEAARVTVGIEGERSGRRVGGRCLAPTRRRNARPRCMRWVHVGTLRTDGGSGANSLAWSGRLRGRPLAPGAYRAAFVATDEAGNVGRRRLVRFAVARRAR